MEERKKKKGLVGKFFSVLSGKPTTEEEKPAATRSKSKFAPRKKEPVDLTFVKNFTASGGKFLYCESESDAYHFLQNISLEAGVHNIYCGDSNLQSILSNAGLKYSSDTIANSDAFCAGCEFLVSFNGGIMISANQTRGKKLAELPDTFVTIARTSQIVENLRAGLTGIRNRYKGDIPSQITTIKGPVKESDMDNSSSSSTCTKDIYLLLLEDQL